MLVNTNRIEKMKNKRMIRLFSIPLVLIMSSLTACSSTALPMLKAKAEAPEFISSNMTNNFIEFISKANDFALPLIENINKDLKAKDNSAYSPVSLFYAIGMLSKVTANEDKQNLLKILKVSEDELNQCIGTLYSACNREFGDRRITGKEKIDNSIWLDEKYTFNDKMLDDLAQIFYTDSFSCNFNTNNKKTNEAISDYVKDCTDGFLKPKYDFNKYTTFVLLNTLYFEDIWNNEGEDLTKDKIRDFKNYDNSVSNLQYYSTYYEPGKIIETEKYKSMYCATYNNFKIDFIVPKDGVNVDDLFTEETLRAHETLKRVYEEGDENSLVRYQSNILTPEFDASFDDDILKYFYSTYETGEIDDFSDFVTRGGEEVDLSIESIVHTTKVEFKKDKVRGAAATAIVCNESEAEPRKIVYDSLLVDRSFIYTIKDPQGINLFQGVVYKL